MSQTAHEHADLIRRLEESHFIFPQAPKLITDAVKAEPLSPMDKILLRAHKIDSNGKIKDALLTAKSYHKGSIRLIYAGYFLFGLIGVLALLSTQMVNFFYVLVALLGWHTVSLLWWLIGLFRQDFLSFFGSIFEGIAVKKPLVHRLIGAGDDAALQHALSLQQDIHRPIKRWHLSKIMHGAWLSSLLGTLLALLGLFLFRRYDFAWESTLLTDAHFLNLMQIFGALPHALGFDLPNHELPISVQNARFAWLIMLSVTLYGLLPRLLAFMVCAVKSKTTFVIDPKQPYYANLIRQFSQSIIDQDDYTPSTKPAPSFDITGKSFVLAALERPVQLDLSALNVVHDFGVVDDKASLDKLIHTAKAADAMICLMVDVHILPDRGVMRKVANLAHAGMVVRLAHADGAQNDHSLLWQSKLDELGIMAI